MMIKLVSLTELSARQALVLRVKLIWRLNLLHELVKAAAASWRFALLLGRPLCWNYAQLRWNLRDITWIKS
jgi:hypothetical protein